MLTDIAVTPIAETIHQLSAQRRSGDLQVRAGRMVKIAFFDHGRLVFASSNLRRDRLGEGLVADGRITAEEFERVSSLLRADRARRFGEALVSAGVMDRYEVGSAVARQARRIVLSLFALGDGVAVFEERDCKIPLDYMVSLSIHRLLYDGIRQMKSEPLVLRGLGPLDRKVVLAEVPPFAYEPRDSPEEKDVLELARRPVTVRRLAWAAGGLTLARLRATYALLGAGLLREADADTPQPVVQSETGAFILSGLNQRPEPSGRAALRREIQQELAESARVDREEWLEKARTAGPAEILRALEEKMDRYHELSEQVRPEDSLRTGVDTVLGRLATALRAVRKAVDSAPSRPAPPEQPTERVEPEMADAGPEAETAPVEPTSLTPAPDAPDGMAAATLPGMVEPARPKPAEATQAPMPSPDTSLKMRPGASSFEGQALVEHLLMEGEVRMTVADYANAVTVYSKLVEAEPRVASHHLRLATAMTCYPRTAKMAEREFYEAARLEPDNADIHYQWGLYYKMMKVKSRAVAEMRAAVRLNPRHRGARTELEVLSPKDTALTSLKKLFR